MNPERLSPDAAAGGETPQWTFEEFSERVAFRKISLLSFAKKLVRATPNIDAEDLVSFTVEKALKSHASYKIMGDTEEARNANLSAWMRRILRNGWLDQIRKIKRHGEQQMPEHFEFESSTPDPERAQLVKDLLERTLILLEEKVPPEQREALLLSVVEGMSYEEIAAWQTAASGTEVPVGTVKSRVSRARQALGGSSGLDEE